jgi:hypothetical protein
MCSKGEPQTRHSSGKTELNSAAGTARSREESTSGLANLSHLLGKTHLHPEKNSLSRLCRTSNRWSVRECTLRAVCGASPKKRGSRLAARG